MIHSVLFLVISPFSYMSVIARELKEIVHTSEEKGLRITTQLLSNTLMITYRQNTGSERGFLNHLYIELLKVGVQSS